MADQLARGLFANFDPTEKPFEAPNSMEDNLRLIDDHLGLYTVDSPAAPGVYPADPEPGDGQIFTDGTYAVYNAGSWKVYPARPGIVVRKKDADGAWQASLLGGWIEIADAALITFLQSGTGAQKRSVQIKLREFVSVKDFGAVGDDGTNDTAAIQKAVTYGIANGLAVYFPKGTYLCGALAVPSAGDLIWYSEGGAEIKCAGADITLVSPTGNVTVTGLKFTGYMVGFNFAGIAANKTVKFKDCIIESCGTINTGGGRSDFQGFITNKNAASNRIARLEVVRCNFTGDDFGISWQGKLDSALVTGCLFKTMRRMAVLIGLQAAGRTAKDCENIVITDNTFKDIISNDADEFEIHAVLVYGYRVKVSGNIVDTCYDIHASVHDSEAIYVKAVFANVSDNIVQDGGRGDSFITAKGVATASEPEDVADANTSKYNIVAQNILHSSNDFVASYGTPFAAIYVSGSRIDVKNNSISGKFNRAIASYAAGHIAGNTISAEFDYGILHVVESDLVDQAFVKITDNFVEALGVTSAGISSRLATVNAVSLAVCQIDNNIVRLGPAATLTGESACISVRADRVAAGNNTYNFVQVNNNSLHGRAGVLPRAITLRTSTGAGNNGLMTTVHMIGNSARLPEYGIELAGAAGDFSYVHIADATFNGANTAALSGINLATTAKVRNIRGNRVLASSGTAVITAANTEVTVAMGINDPDMRPTTLDLISVRPTNNLGAATKWWIDSLAGDSFKIKVNAAPGGSESATFAWEAKNRYYH